jgi:hypothetical protein
VPPSFACPLSLDEHAMKKGPNAAIPCNTRRTVRFATRPPRQR